jgi:glutaminyl-peptide cyclotransferase
MLRFALCLVAPAAALLIASDSGPFSGERALKYTADMTAFGERPSGSAANKSTADYIGKQLGWLPCRVTQDRFLAKTPAGAVPMKNIIADCGAQTGRLLVVTGHYDTKRIPGFVGANDGGSSAGLLLELARAVASAKWKHRVRLVWFDGEEAVHPEWSTTDSVYGSTHLARTWQQDGTLRSVDALINVDMIGDKDLDIVQELGSSATLNKLVWQVAADLHDQDAFQDASGAIDDDHMPFRRLGVNAIDLIDFDFGPGNSYWHTPKDTMDKLSAHSLEVVGSVVLETLKRLDRNP